MTKKLTALAEIVAGILAANSPEFQVGQSFEAPDDLADKLIAAGDAREEVAATPTTKAKSVKARVLVDCGLGKINEVIDVASDAVKGLEAEGQIDSSKAAVTYALSLKVDV